MTQAMEQHQDMDHPARHGGAGTAPPQPAGRPRGRTRRVAMGVGVLVLLGAAGGLAHYELRGKYVESTDDAYIQADIVTVAPKVSGYVERVDVANNQEVRAGQRLLRIDPREYAAQLAQYQAQVEAANASADNARAQLATQKATIAQAQAQLQSAEHDAQFTASQTQRYASLVASGAETRDRLSTLQNQAAQARANAAAQRAALTKATLEIAALQAQLRQAEAQAKTARAQAAVAEVNLAATELRASTDGRVGDSQVRIGQFVSAGTRLMSVVPSHLYITANFKETQLRRMRIGQPVHVHVDAFPDEAIEGHVESLSPGTGAQFSLLPPQNATGNFIKIVQRVPVRIALDVTDDQLKPLLAAGMSVTVDVDTLAQGQPQPLSRPQPGHGALL
ncbi:HlyD family secretion protein [Ralstonia solanacearum]|uniref:HlyD family secretion protein n=1 Tax=Ralstonia solanacearum TaxID=305 RepID=A0AAW5ZIT2_RALSL|nr:HlyD family secretion protein [Ralstonia solanacearum]MDB0570175.1 HlyD family secretion protein [Ralstonia solanacearum]